MIKPRILVTGATGKTGRVVVAELLNAGHPVRAMVHREDGRSARLKTQGAEIAVAEMTDVERIADALTDVQRAYYCPPFDPYMIQGAVAFAVAASEAHLEHIVSLTQWLASPSHPALMTRQHWLVDRLFSMTPGVAHTIVRPGFFADAYLVLTGVAANLGVLPWIFGESRNAPPSNEDIARVAVATLMNPTRHAGKRYRPTGPELLGRHEMARAIGRAVGRSVRAVPTPNWIFLKGARMAGIPIDILGGVRFYADDHRQGAFELAAPTTDVLEDRPPGRRLRDDRSSLCCVASEPTDLRQLASRVRPVSDHAVQPWVQFRPLRPRTAPSVSVRAAVRARVCDLAARARYCWPCQICGVSSQAGHFC
jgi:NAD(P)H dehydrogenase (quinone)